MRRVFFFAGRKAEAEAAEAEADDDTEEEIIVIENLSSEIRVECVSRLLLLRLLRTKVEGGPGGLGIINCLIFSQMI